MSKIANRIILIPENVKINLDKENFFVEGPLGRSRDLSIPNTLEIINNENELFIKSENVALAGTYNSLIFNMIKGVMNGYEEVLEIKGIGYKVSMKDGKLELSLGKSHLNHVYIPQDLEVKAEGNKIIVKGLDKQVVRNFVANDIRPLRMPSIYKKAKGIYYQGEEKYLKLKAGKSLNK